MIRPFNFILCLYSQVGMFWLENMIWNLDISSQESVSGLCVSNLNFIHKKAKFVLSFMVSFIQKIISFSLFLSYCLTNTLPSLLILPDFIPLQLCSFFKSWLPIVYQALCQSWEIKYFLPWSLPSQNSFPTIQAMCYPHYL